MWEVSSDGRDLRQVAPGLSNACCGNWTADGRYFVFQALQGDLYGLWAIREKPALFYRSSREPARLSTHGMDFRGAVLSSDGQLIFSRVTLPRAEPVVYNMETNEYAPLSPAISAETVAFSPDGAWVVYTSVPERHMFRSRRDGSDKVRLTPPDLQTALPRFSPDGSRIVFMARHNGAGWGIYTIEMNGGQLSNLLPGQTDLADPDWSPDGKQSSLARIQPGRNPVLHVFMSWTFRPVR